MRPIPTAPIAAAVFIAGYGVVAVSGSRPLGGLVLAAGGILCVRIWARRHDTRTAVELAGVGFGAFVLSHVLALAIGPWPAVLALAAASAVVVWKRADAQLVDPARGLVFRPRTR